MSKELTPLEALKQFRNSQYQGVNVYADELLDIIETALKRISELEKELCFVKTMEDLTIEAIKDKKLKALEIIKKKLPPLMRSALLDYCTKEEYDILKEVLM